MPAERSGNWTTLADLRGLSLTAWSRGQLLRELLEPGGVYPRRRSLKRPTAAGLRSDYTAARAWAAELFAATGHFTLETAEVGRTTIGSNLLPAAAVFASADDEIAFVGRSKDAARFRELAAGLSKLDPAFRAWALRRPLQLLELGGDALTAARVALWLRDNPEPGIYLRQLRLPGVHTKFIEHHRKVIGELAAELSADPPLPSDVAEDEGLPDAAGPGSLLGQAAARTPAARFAARHGFLHPPELVRFRALDPELPLLGEARDLTVTAEAFGTLRLPGVHTKFIEHHRKVIGELAAELSADPPLPSDVAEDDGLPDAAVPGSLLGQAAARTPSARFTVRHGFLHPPELVRFRALDPQLPLLGEARDLTVTAEAFSTLRLPVTRVIVTENLVNFLALPEQPETLAIYGGGYGFSSLQDAGWLRDCGILYWGDLDTLGFRILDQLRAVHPHVASVLMDQATLLAHRDAWGSEPAPSRAALSRLTADEAALYEALGSDAHGPAVRLEQELIRWDWALERLLGARRQS